MIEKFNEYISQFNAEDNGINRKIEHSKRVSKLMVTLAKRLNWNEEDILIAQQLGLLHDIGRFEEWKIKSSFVTLDFDHGEYGVGVLKNNNIYQEFGIKEEHKEIIFNAICYHNKIFVNSDEEIVHKSQVIIPEDANDKYLKLLRDADKLDNFYMFSSNTTVGNNFEGLEVTKEVLDAFNREKAISIFYVKTALDYKLLVLAWIFDINYDVSLLMIKEATMLTKRNKEDL